MRRNLYYALSWACFLAWLLTGLFANDLRIAWLCGVGWGLSLTLFSREDALVSGRALPTMSLWLVFLFWPIAVPICVIRLHGLLYGTILAGMHLLIYCGAYIVAALLTLEP